MNYFYASLHIYFSGFCRVHSSNISIGKLTKIIIISYQLHKIGSKDRMVRTAYRIYFAWLMTWSTQQELHTFCSSSNSTNVWCALLLSWNHNWTCSRSPLVIKFLNCTPCNFDEYVTVKNSYFVEGTWFILLLKLASYISITGQNTKIIIER